jgi:hypothetical protein
MSNQDKNKLMVTNKYLINKDKIIVDKLQIWWSKEKGNLRI